MRRWLLLLAALISLGLIPLAFAVTSATPLHGKVGPGFAISLADASGAAVQHLDPGAYDLTVDDLSDEHNFHLSGPGGVDVSTTVDGQETRTVDVTLVDGKYDFICDAHPTRMHGSFTVGAVTQPAPKPQPTRLTLAVSDRAVTLRTAAALPVRALKAGLYAIKVVDRSRHQNGHLTGAGVNRRTGIAFVGTVTWTVRLKAGTLRVRSDAAKPRLRAGTVRVSSG
jgi:hypothetical protein